MEVDVSGWEDYPSRDPSVVGTIKVKRGVHSPQLDNARDILVYLPPSYASGISRYPVVYMHDGQNLFDRTTSFAGEWEVDQTMEAASAEGLEAIIVAVPNMGPARCDEYSPWRDRKAGGGRGDDYVAFLADTLKPMIDADYRTSAGRASTGIAGSSMGGLISLYAFFRRPEVFGFTGVMSPSLWFADRAIYGFVEKQRYRAGKIYLDVGTGEGRKELDDVRGMRDLLAAKGYGRGRDLHYYVEKDGRHDEASWARRIRRELEFLLGRTPTANATAAQAV